MWDQPNQRSKAQIHKHLTQKQGSCNEKEATIAVFGEGRFWGGVRLLWLCEIGKQQEP